MDHAVALVQAYLQINGYFTVADMLIGEVRGGKAELNRNAKNPNVPGTVLKRFGCYPLLSHKLVIPAKAGIQVF